MKMPFRKKKSLARRVLGSNNLTGMVVRYGGLAILVAMAVFEVPAVIRYANIERM
jgi:hypothetical protein